MVYVPRVRCNRFLITHLPLEFQLETRVFKLVLRMVQDLIYPTQADTVMQEDRLVLWWAPLILMDSFICKAHHRTITLPQIYLSFGQPSQYPGPGPMQGGFASVSPGPPRSGLDPGPYGPPPGPQSSRPPSDTSIRHMGIRKASSTRSIASQIDPLNFAPPVPSISGGLGPSILVIVPFQLFKHHNLIPCCPPRTRKLLRAPKDLSMPQVLPVLRFKTPLR